jgi:uncharacterized protein involved in response to NO
MPGFIENGVEEDVIIEAPRWLGRGIIATFLLFFLNQLALQNRLVLGISSATLFVLQTWRLFLWHTPGIWRKPLLWSVYLSLIFIDLGFLLFCVTALLDITPLLAIHTFAFGGIGLVTMGMMSRVTLGHTGRSVLHPPAITGYALAILTLGAVVRVLFPLISHSYYSTWILMAQLLWILSFVLFFLTYSAMLIRPRIDGRSE